MTTRQDYTDSPPRYYVDKFQRRLYRQVAQYMTLIDHLDDTLGERGEQIAEVLNLSADVVTDAELKDHAEKSCLIGLKVEFELFFYIYSQLAMHRILERIESAGKIPRRHQKLLEVIDNKKAYFEAFVKRGFRDAKRLYVQMAVPDYGLERMIKTLEKCGVDVIGAVTEEDRRAFRSRIGGGNLTEPLEPWAQIRTAFQVRHAIEHSFSRIGAAFVEKAKPFWDHSTWRRYFVGHGGPRLGDRIVLHDRDILATAAAMGVVSQRLWHVLVELEGEGGA